MSPVRRFDHVGITVADLDTTTAFFVALGLEVEGRTFMEGEFVDTIIGIPAARSLCCARPTAAPAWSCRGSSSPTTSPGLRPRCPPK